MNSFNKLLVVFLLFASLCSVQMKDVDMIFQNTISHNFVSTKTRITFYAGYEPDLMVLFDDCDFWEGFYVEFPVDYTHYGVSAKDYTVSGGDVEVCFYLNTGFAIAEKEVFVTDYLKDSVWPYNKIGPLTPPETNETLYSSPNGFTTKFYPSDENKNQWCIKSSNFGKIFEPFKGQNKYFVGLSISIADYKTCEDNEKQ